MGKLLQTAVGREKFMRAWLAHCHKQYQMISYRDRTMMMSIGSFAVNALIGTGKLLLGILLFSPWFIVTAIYYLLLCGARGQLLWRFGQTRGIQNPIERFDRQFAVLRHSGVFVCLIGVSYLFICLRMYVWGEGISYPFYMVYGVAGVAFYKIGTAIYGMVVSKRMKNPLLTTMKVIAFVDSCVSIVAVQCALLTMEASAAAATQSSALFGAGCSLVFIGIGIYMLLRKKEYPRPDEFDIKDKVVKPKTPKISRLAKLLPITGAALFSNRPDQRAEQLATRVAEEIWRELRKSGTNGRFVCTVTYERGEIHLSGFSDMDFDYEACARETLRAFDSRLENVPIVCSVQRAESPNE